MQDVAELACVVSVADYFHLKLFLRLENGVFDHRLKDGYLLLGEGVELSRDFRSIHNRDLE